ncbi:uncharacterized protein LOC133440450 [Cololabis saira]|uniref:uncharacterized protein LOC133440450 n=1 Tax=Cololabis saira TaxID=129043 RepID=UPI002AD49B25|nr:uncharacterized protein LOC133440450 [Cololabis saira]
MAQKKPQSILKDSLDDLSEENFKQFCASLVDPRQKIHIALVKVEGKSRLEIKDVMISTFGEQRALEVAEKILRYINCTEAANKLAFSAKEAGVTRPGSANMEKITPKKILNDFLDELPEEKFKEFCGALLERKKELRVLRVDVEGKSRREIADVMIRTFMEQGALEVAEEILREIRCTAAAEKLALDKVRLIQHGGEADMDQR